MDSFKLANRWNSIHQTIKQKKTGALREFSKRIGICKSQLNNEIQEMKLMGAPIEYCKIRNTYYYTHEVEFFFGFKQLQKNDLNNLKGGNANFYEKYFCLSIGSGQAECNIVPQNYAS